MKNNIITGLLIIIFVTIVVTMPKAEAVIDSPHTFHNIDRVSKNYARYENDETICYGNYNTLQCAFKTKPLIQGQ